MKIRAGYVSNSSSSSFFVSYPKRIVDDSLPKVTIEIPGNDFYDLKGKFLFSTKKCREVIDLAEFLTKKCDKHGNQIYNNPLKSIDDCKDFFKYKLSIDNLQIPSLFISNNLLYTKDPKFIELMNSDRTIHTKDIPHNMIVECAKILNHRVDNKSEKDCISDAEYDRACFLVYAMMCRHQAFIKYAKFCTNTGIELIDRMIENKTLEILPEYGIIHTFDGMIGNDSAYHEASASNAEYTRVLVKTVLPPSQIKGNLDQISFYSDLICDTNYYMMDFNICSNQIVPAFSLFVLCAKEIIKGNNVAILQADITDNLPKTRMSHLIDHFKKYPVIEDRYSVIVNDL